MPLSLYGKEYKINVTAEININKRTLSIPSHAPAAVAKTISPPAIRSSLCRTETKNIEK